MTGGQDDKVTEPRFCHLVSLSVERYMSIWNAVLVITRTRFLIARNTFWRGKIGRKIALLGLAAALCVAAYGLYWLTRGIVRGITSPDFAKFLAEAARRSNGQLAGFSLDFRTYLLALPALVLFLALVLMVLTSFTTVLSSLYLSGDIDMLLVAPVPMRAVFVVKFFGGLLTPYALLFFLLGPLLLGFGQGLGFGAVYFVVAVVVLLLLPLLPTGLGALLVMAVVRVIPARRAREIVGVIGGLVGVSWYIVSQFTRELTPRIANARLLDYLRRFDNPIAPSAWAARALVAAGEGRWPALLFYGGLFAALSVGVFILCLALAERLYYAGWSNMSTQGGRIRTKNREQRTKAGSRSFALSSLFFVLPEQSRAILYKDLKVFPRDLRNLQQLIFPLVLAGIWTFRLITGGSVGNSREGRGFWLFKVAPISARRLLLGKLALAYLPFPLVGTLFVIFLSLLQHSAPIDFLRSLVLVLVAGLGVSSISMGLGAAFPKFNWESPRQQNSFQAGCLSPILYMAYLGVAIGVVLGVPELGRLIPDFRLALTAGSWIFFFALTALVVWGALAFGAARLERIEIA